MKELGNEEDIIKCAQLDLLNEFKRICNSYNLKYTLVGGTLIGAVRHNGFIPWDDDIDVGMLRKDYDKFIEICDKELDKHFYIKDWNNDKLSPNPFLKMKIKHTHYKEKIAKDANVDDGIFIDIFPFDNIPDNGILREFQRIKLFLLKKIVLLKCNYNLNETGFKRKFLYNSLRLISMTRKLEDWKKSYTQNIKKYNNYETDKVANLCGSYSYDRESIEKEIFNDFISHEFEKYTYSITKGYHEYLSHVYGDYMQLPPEEQRKGRHEIFEIDLGGYKVKSILK